MNGFDHALGDPGAALTLVEYGSYNCHELAHEVEVSLLRRGYQSRIDHH